MGMATCVRSNPQSDAPSTIAIAKPRCQIPRPSLPTRSRSLTHFPCSSSCSQLDIFLGDYLDENYVTSPNRAHNRLFLNNKVPIQNAASSETFTELAVGYNGGLGEAGKETRAAAFGDLDNDGVRSTTARRDPSTRARMLYMLEWSDICTHTPM